MIRAPRQALSHILLIAILALSAAAVQAGPLLPQSRAPGDPVALRQLLVEAGRQGAVSAACCRVCHTGQACGNACISRSKSCHKGQGCACDG
ncbi:hypothetical protein KM176_07255 [Pseudooceanicola sp. CBS1P-1]|uniref:Uncharacterized protein n=1 Tax=Pseudooceanicola albus TaxID=2692189 RepID=A0A6L7FZH2_9RHOB|nr:MULTISPECIES: hypothetical protein [Pseudooceanicola]MBT9383649.1 hypothetical protein [Pseudooceanicola endophyticus]MXN17504.1 hypothetical protein [Pseudooceanicola albus]